MPFDQERVDQAYHYWRCMPFYQRNEHELCLALQRHGLVEIDARNYARDLIAGATDLEPDNNSLHPYYCVVDTPEGFHKISQQRWRELALRFGCPGHKPTFPFIEEELAELKRLREAQKGEGPATATTAASTGNNAK